MDNFKTISTSRGSKWVSIEIENIFDTDQELRFEVYDSTDELRETLYLTKSQVRQLVDYLVKVMKEAGEEVKVDL